MSIRNKNMTAWKPKSVRLIFFNHLMYFFFYKKGKNVSLLVSLSNENQHDISCFQVSASMDLSLTPPKSGLFV